MLTVAAIRNRGDILQTVDFLDAVKRRHDLTSDYGLAKLLQTTPQRISNYRRGRDAMGEEMAMKVAELLEVAPAYVLASVAAERATSDAAKSAWTTAAKTLAGSALLLAGCALGVVAIQFDITEIMVATAQLFAVPNIHYAQSEQWISSPLGGNLALVSVLCAALFLACRKTCSDR